MLQTHQVPLSTDLLLAAQRDIELRASQEGFDRYIKQQQSSVDNLGGQASSEAVKIIRGSIPLVSAQITAWLDANDRTGAGKRPTALSTIKRFDPDMLAFLALNSIFSGITKEHSVTAIQTAIGGQVEAEVMALDLAAHQDKKVASRIAMVTAKQGNTRNRQKAFKKLATEQLPKHVSWAQDYKVRIAEPLVNAVLIGVAELFELVTIFKSKNHQSTIIRLTEEGVQLFGQLRESMAWMQPIHRPMVVPPRPWADFDTGCYYEPRSARTVNLVRTFNKDHRKLVKEAIANGSMDFMLKAVNATQNTAWAVNQPILALVKHCFDTGITGLGLPAYNLLTLPPRMDKDQWEAMDLPQRKGHRIELAGIHERNRGTVSDQAVLLRDMETAKELSAYGAFWLPHNLDFRGRIYPVPHFNHQRADHIKALFQFSKGEPLGENGAAWLSVHLANCGDFDKMSKATFDDRLQWVEDNEGFILSVGEDPYATIDQWKEADSPFMFVAACIDYYNWVQSGFSDDYCSHLAVALDGSNSGLQHYAAALRSAEEAALVSLTPCDKPADLYQTVADKVVDEATLEAEQGDPMAALCLKAGIDRSLVKRNVMTFAYSSEQFGFRQQLMEDLMRPLNEEVFLGLKDANPYASFRKDTTDLDGGFNASGYLAARVWKAVTATVTKATEGMDYFKKLAATLAHERLPLIWTTPLGLPVMHKYSVWETKTVKLFLYDRSMPVTNAGTNDKITEDGEGVIRRVQLNLRTKPLDRIDKDKARSAVAPNVIHSMDGSHLLLTVLNSADEGLTDFALIHDSFGTHAGKTARFFDIIRESFVEMYDNYCPFEETRDYALSVLSDEGIDKLPPLPTKGDMDLNCVLDAQYAFA
jgi:DNA-directed RNA polymerase